MSDTMTQVTDKRAFDETVAALSSAAANAQAALTRHEDHMHHAAGDKQHADYGYGRRGRMVWGMNLTAVTATLAVMDMSGRQLSLSAARDGYTPGSVLAAHVNLTRTLADINTQIAEKDAIYRADPWQRFFPCMANNGHIHASAYGCPTVRWTTDMRWHPSLSGHTAAEAVAELGPALCSKCFPAAPVEWTAKTLTEIEQDRTAGQRAAERAERDAAKAVKNLTADEQFRDAHHDRVTTVATAKQVLRDERHFAHFSGIDQPHPSMHEDAKVAAETARRVLLARGVTAEELDTIVARADAKQRRDWAKINREK
jgi:hypothetical protein